GAGDTRGSRLRRCRPVEPSPSRRGVAFGAVRGPGGVRPAARSLGGPCRVGATDSVRGGGVGDRAGETDAGAGEPDRTRPRAPGYAPDRRGPARGRRPFAGP